MGGYAGSSDAPKAWVTSVAATDAGLAALIAKLMSISTIQSIEDKVAARSDTFARSTIERHFDLEELHRRIAVISSSGLADNQIHALNVLKTCLGHWLRTNEPD